MPVLCRWQREVRPQAGGGAEGTREEVTTSRGSGPARSPAGEVAVRDVTERAPFCPCLQC
jgi:hypothetical protein